MASFLTDTLIISNPALSDIPKFSNIAGCAIYIIEHSANGAIGICLNKAYSKSFTEIAETVPTLSKLTEESLLIPKVIMGGPLFSDAPWILGRNPTHHEKSIQNNVLSMNFAESAFSENQPLYKSVCGLGTFGWGAGQLEQEIANFLWHIIPTTEESLTLLPMGGEYRGAINLLATLKFD